MAEGETTQRGISAQDHGADGRGREAALTPAEVEAALAPLEEVSEHVTNPPGTAGINQVRTPLELWQDFVHAPRAFAASPTGVLDIDPRGIGPKKMGHGHSTFAVFQIVDRNGDLVLLEFAYYRGGGDLHAEQQIARSVAALLEVKESAYRYQQYPTRRASGGLLTVVGDKEPCPKCDMEIDQLARRLGLSRYQAYVIQREKLVGRGLATGKTTALTAHRADVLEPVARLVVDRPLVPPSTPTPRGQSASDRATASNAIKPATTPQARGIERPTEQERAAGNRIGPEISSKTPRPRRSVTSQEARTVWDGRGQIRVELAAQSSEQETAARPGMLPVQPARPAPVWVVVWDERSGWLELDINHPDPATRALNRQQVAAHLTTRSEGQAERRSGMPPPAPSGIRARTRLGGGILLLVEAVNLLRDIYTIVNRYRSAAQWQIIRKLQVIGFWHRFGLEVEIGFVQGGREVALALVADIDTWVPKLDAIFLKRVPNEQLAHLQQNVASLREFYHFLQEGSKCGALAGSASEEGKRLPARVHWYVAQAAYDTLNHVLTPTWQEISPVVQAMQKRLFTQEQQAIRGRATIPVPPAGRGRIRDRAELSIDRNRILAFAGAEMDVFDLRDGRQLMGKADWGALVPQFFQVGPEDIGTPFLFSGALLVTGANAVTNAILYDMLLEQSPDALVMQRQPTLGGGRGQPLEWTIPLVYVLKRHIKPAPDGQNQ